MAERSEELQAFSIAYVAEAIRQSEGASLNTPEKQIAWYNRCVAGHALGISLFRMSLEPAEEKEKEN